jgi:hypothetical protein
MIECMQQADLSDDSVPDDEQAVQFPPQQLLALSAAALNTGVAAVRTLQLLVHIQGHKFLFLVDSGSSSCFIDQRKAELLSGSIPLTLPIPVQVAGGAILQCNSYFPALQWEADGTTFTDPFKILDLSSYDGIVGLDWLGKYSPMTTHWEQGWISIQYQGKQVVLRDERDNMDCHSVFQIHLLHEAVQPAPDIAPDVQAILDQFASVFAAPTGLPPRRRYDHHIPLISGARPVSVRPYRVAPELKDEIEKQIKELLAQGVISHSCFWLAYVTG